MDRTKFFNHSFIRSFIYILKLLYPGQVYGRAKAYPKKIPSIIHMHSNLRTILHNSYIYLFAVFKEGRRKLENPDKTHEHTGKKYEHTDMDLEHYLAPTLEDKLALAVGKLSI